MKKNSVIKIISVVLSFILLLSGCESENNEESTGKKSPAEENRYINCDPQYKNSSSSGGSGCKVGPRSSALAFEDYLINKEKSGFIAGENWLPWEQFSALGEFYYSFWWDDSPMSSQYKYLYTDPETGKSVLYYASAKKISENSGVTNIKEYFQWWYGREYNSWLGKARTLTKSDLSNSNLTAIEKPAYYGNDLHLWSDSAIHFMCNGWMITIYVVSPDNSSDEHPKYGKEDLTFVDKFGIADSDIVKRLLNADTYMEAIEELMDPANGGYVSG